MEHLFRLQGLRDKLSFLYYMLFPFLHTVSEILHDTLPQFIFVFALLVIFFFFLSL